MKNKHDNGLTGFISGTAEFMEGLYGVTSLDEIAEQTLQFVERGIHPSFISFMVFNSSNYELLQDSWAGPVFKRTRNPQIKYCMDVSASIAEGGDILAAPENSTESFIMLYDPDQWEHCEIRIPFFVKNVYIGVLSLGKPGSGMDYSIEIIDLLRIIARHLAIVCQTLHLEQDLWKDRQHSAKEDENLVAAKSKYQPFIRIKRQDDSDEIIGHSAGLVKVKEIVKRIAPENIPVLITGESGTGKELVARSIHKQSSRADKPLVTMNCAAMPESLVESELFGHEKGAFTGATTMKKGKFEFAHQSTLFLDEIGDMDLQTQAKLLRVLQDGRFQRIGSNETIYSDVRLIAATNKDLAQALREGQFREDLFYRINVFQIEMPALRERGDDIILLAQSYLDMFNERYRRQIKGFDSQVVDWLLQYSFPGNVRELRNIIERAVIMSQNSVITINYMPGTKVETPHQAPKQPAGQSLEALEKEHIIAVMRQVNNNKSAAARVLGIARKTLREKIQKYSIEL